MILKAILMIIPHTFYFFFLLRPPNYVSKSDSCISMYDIHFERSKIFNEGFNVRDFMLEFILILHQLLLLTGGLHFVPVILRKTHYCG